MKRSGFTEGRFIGILAERKAGVTVAVPCSKHGVSDATVFKLKAKFGGTVVIKDKWLSGLKTKTPG